MLHGMHTPIMTHVTSRISEARRDCGREQSQLHDTPFLENGVYTSHYAFVKVRPHAQGPAHRMPSREPSLALCASLRGFRVLRYCGAREQERGGPARKR